MIKVKIGQTVSVEYPQGNLEVVVIRTYSKRDYRTGKRYQQFYGIKVGGSYENISHDFNRNWSRYGVHNHEGVFIDGRDSAIISIRLIDQGRRYRYDDILDHSVLSREVTGLLVYTRDLVLCLVGSSKQDVQGDYEYNCTSTSRLYRKVVCKYLKELDQ